MLSVSHIVVFAGSTSAVIGSYIVVTQFFHTVQLKFFQPTKMERFFVSFCTQTLLLDTTRASFYTGLQL